jgi:hypothetical protein
MVFRDLGQLRPTLASNNVNPIYPYSMVGVSGKSIDAVVTNYNVAGCQLRKANGGWLPKSRRRHRLRLQPDRPPGPGPGHNEWLHWPAREVECCSTRGLSHAAGAIRGGSRAGAAGRARGICWRPEFFVRYESSDGPVYAGGDWSNRIDLRELEQGSEGTYSGPYILPLDYQQREPW